MSLSQMELISPDLTPADIFIFRKWKPSLMEENFRVSRTTQRIATTKGNFKPLDVNDDCFVELFERHKMHVAVKQDYSE